MNAMDPSQPDFPHEQAGLAKDFLLAIHLYPRETQAPFVQLMDQAFGTGNWTMRYILGINALSTDEAFQLFERSYEVFLDANPRIVERLISKAGKNFGAAPSNESGAVGYHKSEGTYFRVRNGAIQMALQSMVGNVEGCAIENVWWSELSADKVPFVKPEATTYSTTLPTRDRNNSIMDFWWRNRYCFVRANSGVVERVREQLRLSLATAGEDSHWQIKQLLHILIMIGGGLSELTHSYNVYLVRHKLTRRDRDWRGFSLPEFAYFIFKDLHLAIQVQGWDMAQVILAINALAPAFAEYNHLGTWLYPGFKVPGAAASLTDAAVMCVFLARIEAGDWPTRWNIEFLLRKPGVLEIVETDPHCRRFLKALPLLRKNADEVTEAIRLLALPTGIQNRTDGLVSLLLALAPESPPTGDGARSIGADCSERRNEAVQLTCGYRLIHKASLSAENSERTDQSFGTGNWTVGFVLGGKVISTNEVLALFVQSYELVFRDLSASTNQLNREADEALNCNAPEVELPRDWYRRGDGLPGFTGIAIRRALSNMNVSLPRKTIGNNGNKLIGITELEMGNVEFVLREDPLFWGNYSSVADFWQYNQYLFVKAGGDQVNRMRVQFEDYLTKDDRDDHEQVMAVIHALIMSGAGERGLTERFISYLKRHGIWVIRGYPVYSVFVAQILHIVPKAVTAHGLGTEEMFKLIDPLVPALPLCQDVGGAPLVFLVHEMPKNFRPVAHPALLCACLNHLENLSSILRTAVLHLQTDGIPAIQAEPFWRNYLKTIPVLGKGPNAIRKAILKLETSSAQTYPLLRLLLEIRKEMSEPQHSGQSCGSPDGSCGAV